MDQTPEPFEIETGSCPSHCSSLRSPLSHELTWGQVLLEERRCLDQRTAARREKVAEYVALVSAAAANAAATASVGSSLHRSPSDGSTGCSSQRPSASPLMQNGIPGRLSNGSSNGASTPANTAPFPPGMPFSLAFSGGGVRASAFQAGVLWRLAKEGRMQDVEYMVGVSGGGYLASALASQCLEAQSPKPDESLRDWYLERVAKTICRLQLNSSAFVRDCVRNPGWTADVGAGWLPRILDVPALLVTLGFTLLVNPMVFMTCILVPFTFCIELFYGAAMRAAFCHPHHPLSLEVLTFFLRISPLMNLIYAFIGASTLAFVSFCVTRICPCCRFERHKTPTETLAPTPAVIGHATNAFLARFSSGLLMLIFFLVVLPVAQSLIWGRSGVDDVKFDMCAKYVYEEVAQCEAHCSNMTISPHCAQATWFDDKAFQEYSAHRPVSLESSAKRRFADAQRDYGFNITAKAFMLLLSIALLALFFAPLFGGKCLLRVIKIGGPFLLFALMISWVQYFVFGPVTGNGLGITMYNEEAANNVVSCSLLGALLLVFFYDEFRSVPHVYYRRSLQQAFFANGADHSYTDVADNPYCPYLLLTGVSNDYMPPGSDRKICELFFSSLHCGGPGTGYLRTPKYRSLAKCTALTSAGCLDALSLSIADTITMRFWLEVLNLCWGDYIIFDRSPNAYFSDPESKLSRVWERYTDRFLLRLASSAIWIGVFVLFNLAWESYDYPDGLRYEMPALLTCVALTALSVFLGLSFFSIAEVQWLRFLTLSPLTRQIHQSLRYLHVGNWPPRMLYITDGGVLDCTGIGQLVRRRAKRILLVFAASDPTDELAVLKEAMEGLESVHMASFYSPVDPRKGIKLLFEEFRRDKDMPYLHLGINYPENDMSPTSYGHLVVVKNRLPTRLEGMPIQPELTEDEIRGHSCASMYCPCGIRKMEGGRCCGCGRDLRTEDLGTFNCCDCCNSLGLSCGPKFPHGAFSGYLYLTPKYCSALVRLGFEVSAEAVNYISKAGPLEADWEAAVQQMYAKCSEPQANAQGG